MKAFIITVLLFSSASVFAKRNGNDFSHQYPSKIDMVMRGQPVANVSCRGGMTVQIHHNIAIMNDQKFFWLGGATPDTSKDGSVLLALSPVNGDYSGQSYWTLHPICYYGGI